MRKLSIPERITLERMYLPGIGLPELRRLLLCAVPLLCAAIAAWNLFQTPGAKLLVLLCVLGIGACCYAVMARIDGGQSIYDFCARRVRYLRGQNRYFYKEGRQTLYALENPEENE